MPEELAFTLVLVVVIGFIVLVTAVIAAVIVSRAIRLARGGPAADRLRQQLAQQSQSRFDDGHTAAMRAHQTVMDMQQQIAIDIANSAATTSTTASDPASPA